MSKRLPSVPPWVKGPIREYLIGLVDELNKSLAKRPVLSDGQLFVSEDKPLTIVGENGVMYSLGVDSQGNLTLGPVPTPGRILANGVLRANAATVNGTDGVVPRGVLQHAYTSSGAVVISSTIIGYDDTIPQITEGHQAFFIDFTPKRADSRIRISTNLHLRSDNTSALAAIVAVFEAGVNDALGATAEFVNMTAPIHTFGLSVDIASTGTTQRTFSVRFGPHNTGSIIMNGNEVGTRVFGGASMSSMEIMEYMP